LAQAKENATAIIYSNQIEIEVSIFNCEGNFVEIIT
jgi:hypothetical protein